MSWLKCDMLSQLTQPEFKARIQRQTPNTNTHTLIHINTEDRIKINTVDNLCSTWEKNSQPLRENLLSV